MYTSHRPEPQQIAVASIIVPSVAALVIPAALSPDGEVSRVIGTLLQNLAAIETIVLLAAVACCIYLIVDRLRLRRAFRLLEHKAQRDGLTGLLHAGAFHEILRVEAQRANRYDRDLSVIIMDMNDFKQINDRFGHPTGDRALQFVSSVLVNTLREVDVIARIGGDEFAVLLPETAADQAELVAERLRTCLTTRLPNSDCSISVSVGVTSWVPGITDQALYSAADACLYSDKRARKHLASTRVAHAEPATEIARAA